MSDKPIFKLAPVEDDQTKRVLQARREVLCDETLDYGARCLWCLLTDASYLESMHEKTGVIAFSKSQLAALLKCSPRAVAYWRAQLQTRGYIWTSNKAIPNAWPVTVWHVTVLDPKPRTHLKAQTTAGGLLNGGQTLHPRQRNEKRSNSGKFCTRQGQSLPTATAKFAPGKGKVCTGERQPIAHAKGKVCTSRGQSLPLPTANFAPGNGNPLPTLRSLPTVEKEIKEGEEAPPRKGKEGEIDQEAGFEEWRAGLKKQFPRELKELLGDLNQQRKGGDPDGRISRKIDAVMVALYGPGATTSARKAAKPVAATVPPVAMTAAEIASSREYLEANGMTVGQAYRHLVALEKTAKCQPTSPKPT